MMLKPTLILASSSPARKNLLNKLQIPFEVIPAHIDESPQPNEDPQSLAIRLAIEKAQKIAGQFKGTSTYVIGADQVIMHKNSRLDKPITKENARQQLTLVSGKSALSYTGLCLWNCAAFSYQSGVETCEVFFRLLTQTQINTYIEKDKPYHCAGSIKAEGLGITLLSAIKSHDESALIGLPLIRLTDFLMNEKLL